MDRRITCRGCADSVVCIPSAGGLIAHAAGLLGRQISLWGWGECAPKGTAVQVAAGVCFWAVDACCWSLALCRSDPAPVSWEFVVLASSPQGTASSLLFSTHCSI